MGVFERRLAAPGCSYPKWAAAEHLVYGAMRWERA
jgi:hypothetical protein